MKKLILTTFAINAMAAFNAALGVDGLMFPSGNRNWDYAENWKDGIIADGEDATAYLYYTNPNCEIKFNGDAVLHALKVSGVRVETAPLIRTSSAPTAALLMKNNPIIQYMPAYHENTVVNIKGSEFIKGDGTALTFEGGALMFENNNASKYMMTNFSQVVMKSHPNVWMQGTGCGLAACDTRLENTNLRFVWNKTTATTANKFVDGTLTIGPGLSDVQWDGGRSCQLANSLVRERAGMFRINPNGEAGMQCIIPNAAELTGTKGRLPTWFLRTGDTFNFLAYDNGTITDANSSLTAQFASSTKDDAVIYSGGALPGASSLTAAAVSAKAELNLSGKSLTLGNESEPGLLTLNANVNGGEISFVGEEGLLVCAGATKERRLGTKISGTSSISYFGGYKEVANVLWLDNAANDFTGGIDLMTGNLRVSNADALGTGAIRVHGYPASYEFGISGWRFVALGGSLGLDGCTVTNDISLAGMGIVNMPENVIGHADRSTAAALYLMKNSGVESKITLNDTSAIRTAKDSGEITISGTITDATASEDFVGEHELYLWAGTNSVLKLSNEITSGGIVITAPTNAPGVREIGTVAFNSSTVVNTKTIRNDGTLKCEGTPTINGIFDGGSGTLLVDDGAVLSLNGNEQRIGSLSGNGTIAIGENCTMTIGSDEACNDAVFAGAVVAANGAAVTIVKESANTQTVTKKLLAMNGKIVVNGGTLKFGDVEDSEAANVDLTVNEGGIVDLAGVSASVKTLVNFGTIRNSSETPVVLTVNDASLVGNIEGKITILVDGGKATLKNWRNMRELSVTQGMNIHLDAADLSTLLMNDAGQVTNWLDKSGCGNNFVENRSGDLCAPPMYDAATNSNRGAVCFNAPRSKSTEANRLTMTGKCLVKTAFFVTSVDPAFNIIEEGGYDSILGVAGLFGKLNLDRGLRLGGSYGGKTWWPTDVFDVPSGGRLFVNGEEKNVLHPGVNDVVAIYAKPDTPADTFRWSLGQYVALNESGNRGYKGTVSEVITYDRILTEEECGAVTEYLRTKWTSETVLQGMTMGDELSFAFANGGKLDLGGMVQTVGSLGGATGITGGAVENGGLTVSDALEVVVNEDGTVTPYDLTNVTLANGLRVVLTGKPSSSRVVIATGVSNADASTFIPPTPVWKISLSNGELSMSASGMVIIIR